MKTKGEVRVFEIDQHAVVTLLDRLSDELSIVHLEGRLLLEKNKFSVVRAQSVIAILLGYGENWGFEIPKRKSISSSDDLTPQTPFIVQLYSGPRRKNRDTSFLRPRSQTEWSLFPLWGRRKQGLIAVVRRCILNRVTVVLQTCDLSGYRRLLCPVKVNRARPTILERTCYEIIGRTPCRLNRRDSVLTEEGF
jgi:hypothetical protein